MKKYILSLILITILPGVCGLCSGATTPAFDQQTTRTLQDSLDTSVAAIGAPGATMTVIRPDGAKWVGVTGLADREKRTPMAPGLKFRIGSVSKTFVATVILKLVQEGSLSLDDTLESILPGLVANSSLITVRQLLNHTSGLFDYAQAQKPFNFLAELYLQPLKKWTPQELVAVANANDPYFPPGTQFHYSNTNYVLLAMIIEKKTKRTYAQEISSRILVPLGLRNTSVPNTPDMPEGSTAGYTYDIDRQSADKWVNTTRFDPSWAFGAGAAISNGEDLHIWLEALMKGSLLDERRRTDMFTFVSMGIPECEYGLGLEKQRDAVGHTGDFVFGGQSALYQYRGWKFIVLVNASPSSGVAAFGSEYIMALAIAALGLNQ
ncbi:MAG: serine hydrolase [Deltaproteobacteria bacterium]|nr:serine hydrolase [Deltaproteobacteria bacterium]